MSFLYEGVTFSTSFGFNNRKQLTSIRITKGVQNYANFTYNYHATHHTGRVESMVRQIWNSSGGQAVNETVTYQYDAIARLISATATTGISGQAWSQTFSYDGFGNLYHTAGTGVAAPWSGPGASYLNSEKNQMGTFDANGNPTSGIFDIANRFVQQSVDPNAHGYDPGNKKVVRTHYNDISQILTREITFYLGDNRLGKYGLTVEGSTYTIATLQEEKYFAGRRLIPQDRLGSAADAWLTPYGTELVSAGKPPTANDRVKFATYYRDSVTGDYADQRYYLDGRGRFSTPDPAEGGDLGSPTSLNLYSYVGADPINANDPSGLLTIFVPGSFSSCAEKKYQPGGDFFNAVRDTFGEVRILPKSITHSPLKAITILSLAISEVGAKRRWLSDCDRD